jgi:hypothetical protein
MEKGERTLAMRRGDGAWLLSWESRLLSVDAVDAVLAMAAHGQSMPAVSRRNPRIPPHAFRAIGAIGLASRPLASRHRHGVQD